MLFVQVVSLDYRFGDGRYKSIGRFFELDRLQWSFLCMAVNWGIGTENRILAALGVFDLLAIDRSIDRSRMCWLGVSELSILSLSSRTYSCPWLHVNLAAPVNPSCRLIDVVYWLGVDRPWLPLDLLCPSWLGLSYFLFYRSTKYLTLSVGWVLQNFSSIVPRYSELYIGARIYCLAYGVLSNWY